MKASLGKGYLKKKKKGSHLISEFQDWKSVWGRAATEVDKSTEECHLLLLNSFH